MIFMFALVDFRYSGSQANQPELLDEAFGMLRDQAHNATVSKFKIILLVLNLLINVLSQYEVCRCLV